MPTARSVAEYVDSHCHIGGEEYDADREEVIARARGAGVSEMLIVGLLDGKGDHQRALALSRAEGFPCAVGVHPHDARLFSEASLSEIRNLAKRGLICAVGEIGLDFHYDLSPREEQAAAFRRQIRFARTVGLPIIVHSREADTLTASILEEEGAEEIGGVIHCFTGGMDLAERGLALGLHISFSGIVAFPRAEVIRDVARRIPEARLLVETDSPYLAPPPHRGHRNEPCHVVEVAAALAGARGVAADALARATSDNFRRLFGVGQRRGDDVSSGV